VIAEETWHQLDGHGRATCLDAKKTSGRAVRCRRYTRWTVIGQSSRRSAQCTARTGPSDTCLCTSSPEEDYALRLMLEKVSLAIARRRGTAGVLTIA
jgi:hypothetical protein